MMYQNAATRLIRFLTVVTASIVVLGCGQGSGQQPIAGTPQPPLTGVLIDSPVEGVTWKSSEGASGVTNALGEFQYLPIETITFSVGDIVLGAVNGAPIITVVQLTKSPNPTTQAAINMLVFLQSIDADGDPTNGIQVSAATAAAAVGKSIDFTAADFATRMATLLSQIVGPDAQVVSDAAALNHFYTTYAAMGGSPVFGFSFPGYPDVGVDTFELVFADEFDSGDMPNVENWTMETGYGDGGWGNNEWQLYTDSPDNVRVEGGNLVIQARCDTPPCGVRDGSITSARINSLNKLNFKFGKISARIKPPVGTAAWPAFWALGANFPTVGWPRSGEIDFMEMHNAFSNSRTTHSTMHWCDDSIQAPGACSFPSGWVFDSQNRTFATSLGDDFHIWEADWDEDGITMSLDGVSYFSRTIDPNTMEEFLEEFFMVLNVAMGGTLGSNNQPPSGAETYPQTMLVDYVRVFQKVGGGSISSRTIDFEDAPETYDFGLSGGFGGGAAAVVPNPVSEGINTSAQVGQMLKFEGEVFAGSKLALPEPIAVPNGGTFTMKVWSPRAVPVLFKLEGATEAERSVTHTGSGWETLTFNFSSFSGSADFITLIFDLGTVGDATNDPANWTFYFDDIVFTPSSGGAPGGSVDFPIDFEEGAETYNFGIEGGFGGGAAAVVTNPQSGGINTSTQVARMLKFSGEVFAGSVLQLPSPLAVAANSTFTMKVWSPRAVMVLLKLEGATETELNVAHGGTGWEELTFDYGSFSSSVTGLTFIFDLGIVGDATGDPDNWTFYFDDITYTAGDSGGDPGGSPGDFGGDFEDSAAAYDFGAEGGFGGGAAQVLANPVSGGINTSAQVVRMLKFSGEVFAGTNWALPSVLEVAAGSMFTMKVWSPRPVMVLLKLEGATEAEINMAHGGSGWELLTYDFSSYSGDVEGFSIIFDLGIVGDATNDPNNWTFYFDDITLIQPGGGDPGGGLAQIDLPITFDDQSIDYTLTDFGSPAAAMTTLTVDPDDSANMVASTIKPLGAPVWAGTTMSTAAGFANAIPFTINDTTIGVRVYSPDAGIPVRLKAENAIGGTIAVEAEAVTTVANEWETLVIDFANQVDGTPALNPAASYKALSIFFNFGTSGDAAGQKTYLWDDVEFGVELPVEMIAPTLTSVSVSSDNANVAFAKPGDTVTVTFTADEAILAPTVVIAGASADAVTGQDTMWQATRTLGAADTEGVVVFSVAYADIVGNAGLVTTQSSDSSAVVFDATSPTLTTSGLAAELVSLDPVTVTFQFSEGVSGFELGDIVVVNGTASAFASADAATYTVAVTPAGQGQLSVNVADAAAQDNAGNTSVAATEVLALVDSIAPTVVIEGVPADIDTLDPFTVTFRFSELVTGFDLADVQVTNGTATDFVVIDGATYSALVDSIGFGDLAVSIAAGAASDAGGNVNPVAVDAVGIFDIFFPTVVITGVPSDFATLDSFAVTFQFSEPIVGFDITAIQVTNGVTSGYVAVDEDTYTVNVTPDGAGDVTVTLVDYYFGDGVGNLYFGDVEGIALIDAVAPTLAIGGVPADFATLNPIAVTFQFSELVSGFDVTDIQVTNGAASGFAAVDGDTYTANVTPDGAGNLTVSVAAGSAIDGVGNSSVAASDATALVDAVAPTVVISGAPADFTTLAAINLTFQFSEAVTGFVRTDIQVTNGTASLFVAVDSDTFTAKVTPNGAGNLTVGVAAAAAQDGVGNASVAATNVVVINNLDTEAPLLTLITIASDNSNPAYATTGNVVTIAMTANETILTPTVTINGVAADTVTGSGAMWQATRTMLAGDAEGDVEFTLDFEDADSNVGPQSTVTTNASSVTFDVTAPSVSINGLPATFDMLDPLAATFQFSEDVTGFDASDVTVTNGALGAFASVNASTYTANVTPNGDGNMTVSIAAGAAADLAGVVSLMPTDVVVSNDLDVQAPTLTVVSIASNNSDTTVAAIGDVITITMTADEAIVAPVVTIGGSAAAVTGSGTAWQATRTMLMADAEGTIAFAIDFEDLVSNAGTQVTATTNASAVVFDRTGPTLTAVSIASNNSNATVAATGDVITITMTANEAIVTPVVTIGGAAAAVTGSGVTWQATRTLLVTDAEGVVAFTINSEDVLSNAGVQVTTTTNASMVTFDRTAPTVAITGLATTFTTLDQIAVTFTFSEDVSGFVLADVTVTNGAADALVAVSATTYTTNVTPNGSGDLTVEVAASVAADVAGNTNTVATETSANDLPPSWQLVWSDSFDGAALDGTNWTARTDIDCPAPCVGQQSYNTNNVSVAGGVLTIQAQQNAGPTYVSGLIDSRGKRELTYGRVEIDAIMPGTVGAAPALMMLPVSDTYGAWPLSGEIDIATAPDLVGGNSIVEQTLHYGLPSPENTATTGMYNSPTNPTTSITYALEWEAGEIRWFVDDVHVLTQTQDNWYTYTEDADGVYGVGADAAPFDQDFYLALSFAVSDSADVSSVFPQTLQIEEVRVFECANAIDPVAGTGCSTGDAGVSPVVASGGPATSMLDVYTDATGVITLDTIDMISVTNTLVEATSGMVTSSDTGVIDGGTTLWRVNVDAAGAVGDVYISSQEFSVDPLVDRGFNIAGAEAAGELLFDMRVNSVSMGTTLAARLDSGTGNSGTVAIPLPADSGWNTYSIKIADMLDNQAGTGLDLEYVVTLFGLEVSDGTAEIDLDNIRVKIACRDAGTCDPAARNTFEFYAQDFEAMSTDDSTALSSDGWQVGANVFTPTGIFIYNYFSFPAPNGGPAFSAVATGQGGVPQGVNVLSVYSDYNNGDHNSGRLIEANVFQEMPLTADDVGKTYYFSFDAKRGNINNAAECEDATPGDGLPCESTALAFLKVIDPANSFGLVVSDEVDTTDLPDEWNRYTVSIEITDASFIDQIIQFGYINVASNYEPAGVYYDNIEVTTSSPAP